MESIDLQNDLKLSFEKLPHTIRLIVSKNNKEWVCRKEKMKNLFLFLHAEQKHLFKGRLQLLKFDDKIAIHVKNELIATISAETFQQTLNKV